MERLLIVKKMNVVDVRKMNAIWELQKLERSALRHFVEGTVGYRLHSLDVYSSMEAYKTGINSFKGW
jgi:hypothetical protein